MHPITIIGVGTDESQLTLGAIGALSRPDARVVLRTERCGALGFLAENGIGFEGLDALYDQAEDFDQLNGMIVKRLTSIAKEAEVCYCVHDVRDISVRLIAQKHAKWVRVIPGVPIDGALGVLPDGPYQSLSAADFEAYQPEAAQGTLVREIDSQAVASELKLRLMERYPEDVKIHLGLPDGGVKKITLEDLDRQKPGLYEHRLCAYIPAVTELKALSRYGFGELNRIMRVLRGENGCPWDREQTHESLTANVVEEAYEVVDAIERGDIDGLYDELGDLLLQVTLHAEIARQHGEFSIDDVTSAVSAKLISRHEHIFGLAQADTPDEVLGIWEQAKKKEKQLSTLADAMRAVTKSLPQLMRAEKVQKKASRVGFDWSDPLLALEKVYEEADELKQAIAAHEGEGEREELGDLLFACVNVARLIHAEPEIELGHAVDKFVRRFEAMEALILGEKGGFEGLSLAEMDEFWGRIKKLC